MADTHGKGRIVSFVCPSADASGARKGIMSPGEAAVRGLVPKGMRRVSSFSTGGGRSGSGSGSGDGDEVESYRAYYSGQEEAQPTPAPEPPPAPAPAAPAAPAAEGHVLRDPDDPGMFSRAPEAPGEADTLDDFYAGLGAASAGTSGSSGTGGKGVKSGKAGKSGRSGKAGRSGGSGGSDISGGSGGSGGLDGVMDRIAALAGENAELRMRAEGLAAQVDGLQARLAAAAAGAAVRIPPPAGEIVRVALSAPESRLKVGGALRDDPWECRLVGALHEGRGGRSAALVVSDTAYASELLAAIRPGPMVVLSESKRTYCVYGGECAKIYGDPGSPDFIAVFWLSLDESGSGRTDGG